MRIIVFAGPSIARDVVEAVANVECRPPVSQGDVYRAASGPDRKDAMNISISAAVLAGTILFGCKADPRYISGPNPDLPFSAAVQLENTLFVSGHLGLDPDTGAPPVDPADEVRLLLDSIEVTLESAGMTMNDFLQVEVYCSDVGLYDIFNTEYRRRFEAPFPARAFIGSGPLLFGARFEMLGIARNSDR